MKTCTVEERESVRHQLRQALNDIEPKLTHPRLMLSREQVREMLSGGMEIGGHSLSHANLPSATYREAQQEISKCRMDLERCFGVTVRAFAYPNGGANIYIDEQVQQLVEEAGYISAWTSEYGFVTKDVNLYQSPRIPVSESLPELACLLETDRILSRLKKRQ